ncbi:hypothetical protein PIB30_051077 [Stylosanthes scabra]|uniref:Uncharacterized protein n=1 Tax=Stylosanthes scabra TaxID=79078 RepID=A0ABU6XGB1_9FABA|nr:hypothetical protein [Stylosanthes scabra]
MIFSRIGRSLSRSSPPKDYLHGDAKFGTFLGALRTNVPSAGAELRLLRFFRGYVAHATARGNGILSNFPANPKIHHRLFSSQGPKRKS